MITCCWTESNLEGFIKTTKYIELAASKMLAITNLAICINLALIVSVSQHQSWYLTVGTDPDSFWRSTALFQGACSVDSGSHLLPPSYIHCSAPTYVVLIPQFDNLVTKILLQSHRTMSRVRSVSSPRLILLFLAISMVIAAASVPFWENIIILGTAFWLVNLDEVRHTGLCLYPLRPPLLAIRPDLTCSVAGKCIINVNTV